MTAEPLPIVVTGGRRYSDPPRGGLAGRVAEALRAILRAHPSGVAVAHGANPAAMGGDALCGCACAELRREGLSLRAKEIGEAHLAATEPPLPDVEGA